MSTTTDTISITKEIIDRMEIRAVKADDSNAVLVEDLNSSFKAWIDVWIINGDVQADWNQYIFHLNDPADVLQRDIQDDSWAFELCTSAAIDYLEDKNILVYKDGAAFITKK